MVQMIESFTAKWLECPCSLQIKYNFITYQLLYCFDSVYVSYPSIHYTYHDKKVVALRA